MTEHVFEYDPYAGLGEFAYEMREPIVRCRDCKHTRKSWNGKRPDFVPDGFFCAYWGGHQLWEPDGFCAWGERRKK